MSGLRSDYLIEKRRTNESVRSYILIKTDSNSKTFIRIFRRTI